MVVCARSQVGSPGTELSLVKPLPQGLIKEWRTGSGESPTQGNAPGKAWRGGLERIRAAIVNWCDARIFISV